MTTAQLFAIFGLLSDLVGALFIGYEVLRRYRGEMVRSKGGIEHVDWSTPELTDDYRLWERRKYWSMAIGLGALTLGFILQMVGVMLQS